jgi:cytochrome P450
MTGKDTALLHRPPAPEPRDKPLGAIALLLALRRNPLTTWTRAHFEEPILHGESIIGSVCVVNDPAGIRHVLVDNAANYRKDDLTRRLLGPGLDGGLLLVEGDTWRMQRRVLAPLFTPRMTARFRPAMADAAQALVARWRRQREGRRIDVAAEFSRVTLDVLERTIFPQGLGRDPGAFIKAVTEYFDTAGRIDPLDLLGLPDWLPRLGRRRAAPALAFFADAVDAIIAKSRASLADATPHDSERADLLTLLLSAADPETGAGLSEHEVRANILTFIGAGHETTANALTWTCYLLSQNPAWRALAEREVDEKLREGETPGPDDLPIVRAVLEEALRLYPPAASLTREAVRADRIGNERIAPGTRIVVSPWIVHRHKRLWTDPGLFDPARFMPGAREKIDRFAYIPFGAGPRICIGMGFAMQEAVIIMASVLKNFRLDPAPGHVVEPVQRVTLRPKGGMPLILRAR